MTHQRRLLLVSLSMAWVGMGFGLTPNAAAQIKGTKAGSAEALEKLQKQRDMLQGKLSPGELTVWDLKVGASGTPTFISGKVIQVIDKANMLVEMRNARTAKDPVIVWLKCSTEGITDGKFFGTGWKDITRKSGLKVTGTMTYKTVDGTKTVFVVEPDDSPDVERKALPDVERKALPDVERKALPDVEGKALPDVEGKALLEKNRAAFKKLEARKAEDKAKRQAQAEAERKAQRLAQEEAARKAAVAKAERQAERNLNYAKKLLDRGESDKAKQRLRQILKDYPGTKGAKEAQKLLKEAGE